MVETRILEPNKMTTFVPLWKQNRGPAAFLLVGGECGTLLRMPATRPKTELDIAYAAVANARGVREYHRRRTEKRSPQRERDIAIALERIRDAMRPLKSMIGAFPYGPPTETAENNREEIRQASLALQRERRKLWKMQVKREETT